MGAIATGVAAVYSAYSASEAQGQALDNQGAAMAHQMQLADKQAAIAQDQYDYYKGTYRPLETALVSEAYAGINPEKYTGLASNDVIQSFDKARGMAVRSLSRYGVNPNSGNFAATTNNHYIAQAAAESAARNKSRMGVDDINWNRKLSVAGLGRGLPANAMTGMGNAGSQYGSAAAAYGANAASAGGEAGDWAQFGLNMADKAGWFKSGG